MLDIAQRSFVVSRESMGNQRQIGSFCTVVSSVLQEIRESVGSSGREDRRKGSWAVMAG